MDPTSSYLSIFHTPKVQNEEDNFDPNLKKEIVIRLDSEMADKLFSTHSKAYDIPIYASVFSYLARRPSLKNRNIKNFFMLSKAHLALYPDFREHKAHYATFALQGNIKTQLKSDHFLNYVKRDIQTLDLKDIKDCDVELLFNFKNLTDLNVSGNNITNSGLQLISLIEQLKSLSISNSPGISENGIVDVFSKQSKPKSFKLKSLDLSKFKAITKKSLEAVINSQQNLESLSLKGSKISDSALSSLKKVYAKTNTLTHLDISECLYITSISIKHVARILSIKSLKLNGSKKNR